LVSRSAPTVRGALNLPRLGVGTNQFGPRVDQRTADDIVAAAIEADIAFFDTAESYTDGASETLLGNALRGRRSRATIATKFSPKSDPIAACEGSLKRLQTDHIDLYQMHMPNPEIPIESTLEALARLIDQGKIVAAGCSNFHAWQLADAHWTALANGLPAFVTAQNRYNLLEREVEQEVLPACRHFGIGLIPYLPLAAGLLSGKYLRAAGPPQGSRLENNRRSAHYLSDSMFDKVERLEGFAAERGLTLLEVAIGGLASTSGVATIIAGVTSPQQLMTNKKASEWTPNGQELDMLRDLTT
jgi:aryl-alcohol dehydrogenase-like predicted oxidoreductase